MEVRERNVENVGDMAQAIVLVKRLSENTVSDYLQTTNVDFLDMFLTAKHLEG